MPPVTGGFNVQFTYKNLRLNVGASYACGGKTSSLMNSRRRVIRWLGMETKRLNPLTVICIVIT